MQISDGFAGVQHEDMIVESGQLSLSETGLLDQRADVLISSPERDLNQTRLVEPTNQFLCLPRWILFAGAQLTVCCDSSFLIEGNEVHSSRILGDHFGLKNS